MLGFPQPAAVAEPTTPRLVDKSNKEENGVTFRLTVFENISW